MAVLHLQFDVDSEVHPELYEMLASIGSSRLQAERLRQLAATGLVWERLRLQAYGRFEVPDLGPQAVPTPAPTPAPAEATPFLAEPIAPRAAHPLQPVHAAPVEATDLPDFIDLSDAVVLADLGNEAGPDPGPIDVPLAEHDDNNRKVMLVESAARPFPIAPAPVVLPTGNGQQLPLHEIRSAVMALPVLTEVVDSAELPNMHTIAAANEATPAAGEAGEAAGLVSTGAQIHELAPVQKAAPRSRLMRMKEKGLFKNE